jgi:hypothetical protein
MSETRMNPEIKARWVADLRSGNFPQGQGTLHRDLTGTGTSKTGHTFCCLGVLCESAVAASVVERVVITNRLGFEGVCVYTNTPDDVASGSYHYLPLPVMEWAGLDETDPFVVINGSRGRLSTFNDDHVDFDVIADAIESQL